MATLGQKPATTHVSFQKQTITGNGGTSYTLQQSVGSELDIAVFINNTRQEPTTAYTASGTSLVMTGAVNSSDNFYVIFLAKAINTIYKRGDKLIGANTDGIGFYNSLTQDFKCDVPKVIHILGAGGAAYGILSELLKHKIAIVYISNRNKVKAEEMANYFKKIKSFSSTRIFVKKSIFERPPSPVGMFINTSSIGMKGQEIDDKKLDALFSLLSRYAIVYDINYHQSKTIFNNNSIISLFYGLYLFKIKNYRKSITTLEKISFNNNELNRERLRSQILAKNYEH